MMFERIVEIVEKTCWIIDHTVTVVSVRGGSTFLVAISSSENRQSVVLSNMIN